MVSVDVTQGLDTFTIGFYTIGFQAIEALEDPLYGLLRYLHPPTDVLAVNDLDYEPEVGFGS